MYSIEMEYDLEPDRRKPVFNKVFEIHPGFSQNL